VENNFLIQGLCKSSRYIIGTHSEVYRALFVRPWRLT